MAQHNLVCITDDLTADGFRLAGIEVVVADDVMEAREAVGRLIDEPETGIIALDQRYADAITERLDRRLESSYRPVLVMLPLGDQANMKQLGQNRLQRLIRRAVGFDVTLKRGE